MKKKVDIYTITSLTFCFSFYLFFAFFDGPVICVDSPSYINMQSSREPLYPLLLAFARGIFRYFPEDFYLKFIVLLQSLLAAVAAFVLTKYLKDELNLPEWSAYLALGMPLAVSFLCRFLAKRGSMYSNSILTEGITISLYLVFFRFLLEYVIHHTQKSLFWCIVLSFLMISARKQMVIAFILLLFSILYIAVRKKSVTYGMLTAVISFILVLGSNAVFDVGYNYMVRGEKVAHSGDVRFIATVAFYTAESEDSDFIEDLGVRELFGEIWDLCNEQGYLGNSTNQGWVNRVSHFGDNYDHIQIDTMWPMVNTYVQEHYECRQEQISEYADQIMEEISKAVIPVHIPEIIRIFTDNFLSGLVLTISQYHVIFIIYSIIAYMIYLALTVFLLKRRGEKKVIIFSILTFASIIINVSLISLVIFCQTRYTIYNMPLFYMSLIVMITVFFRGKVGNTAGEKR